MWTGWSLVRLNRLVELAATTRELARISFAEATRYLVSLGLFIRTRKLVDKPGNRRVLYWSGAFQLGYRTFSLYNVRNRSFNGINRTWKCQKSFIFFFFFRSRVRRGFRAMVLPKLALVASSVCADIRGRLIKIWPTSFSILPPHVVPTYYVANDTGLAERRQAGIEESAKKYC